MVQILVESGHSWSNIKEYSLSEIGVFLKTILKQRGSVKADKLNLLWVANNVDYKRLKELTLEFQRQGLAPETREELEQKEVLDSWNRLASFMGKRK